jgi:hypothetical protein
MFDEVDCDWTSSYSGKYVALWLRRPGFDSRTGQNHIFWGVVFLFFHMHILCEFLLCPYCTDISKMSICMEIIIMHKGLQTGGEDT